MLFAAYNVAFKEIDKKISMATAIDLDCDTINEKLNILP